jgi:hypothetical protein
MENNKQKKYFTLSVFSYLAAKENILISNESIENLYDHLFKCGYTIVHGNTGKSYKSNGLFNRGLRVGIKFLCFLAEKRGQALSKTPAINTEKNSKTTIFRGFVVDFRFRNLANTLNDYRKRVVSIWILINKSIFVEN